MRMSQFEAALCLTLELIKHRAVLNHQVGKKFQRDIALQFFIACQPDDSHAASPEDLDQRVAAKDFMSAGKLTRCHCCDTTRALVSHLDRVYIIGIERKVKPRSGDSATPVWIRAMLARSRLHKTLCVYQDFLVECFRVSAPQRKMHGWKRPMAH